MTTNQQEPTWRFHGSKTYGRLSSGEKGALPDSAFAFPHVRKEPMTDASHVREAIARLMQVADVTDADRDLAFANIQKAAGHFGITMHENNWHQLKK